MKKPAPHILGSTIFFAAEFTFKRQFLISFSSECQTFNLKFVFFDHELLSNMHENASYF